jgi:hypothetical protein
VRLPAVIAASLLLLAGCDGPNRFSGLGPLDSRGGRIPTVDIEAPRGDSLTARPLGDSILVRARVRDDQGLDSVRMFGVAERGSRALGTDTTVLRFAPKVIALPQTLDTVLTRYLQAVPDTTREVVAIVVEAFDTEGLFGADTTRLTVGGPAVDILNLVPDQAVQAGLSLSLQLRATDPNGLIGVEFRISGAFADTIRRSFNPPVDSVRMDTTVVIPPGTLGEIQVLAVARNSVDIAGTDGPIRLRVVAAGATDVTPPSLAMAVTGADRLEVEDSVRVTITGQDNPQGSGVVRGGVTVTALAPGRGTRETRVVTRQFQPPRTGTLTETFAFAPFNIDPARLPDTLVFEITAFLVDASNNCGATVTQGVTQSLPCTVDAASGGVTVAQSTPFRFTRGIVAGKTVMLPAGGRIMDAAVDVPRRNLLLSNIQRDRIEVFRLTTERFSQFIPVGSQPWGIAINRTGDSLLVSNSGGTNVSAVYLGPLSGEGPAFEVPGSRFLTPDVLLFDTERKLDANGRVMYNVFVLPDASPPGFSDRPQFLVQDYTGRVLYSTKTTPVGDFGTIRKAFVPEGAPSPEVKLFWEHGAMVPAEDWVGVGNADEVFAVRSADNDEIVIIDHVPGFPDSIIIAGPAPSPEDAAVLARNAGSDAVAVAGRFSVQNIGFTDTTFVGISGDRRWAIFGEGRAVVGRVIMYDATVDRISNVIEVTDLMTNAAESVRGIGLNYDGTLGVARGIGAYFFTTDLRLQGISPLPAGGAGAVLHPLHANARSLSNPTGVYEPNTHLAFAGTGDRTIDIIDTFHFFRSGRIFIRDVISGPLKAVLPFPEDNAGRQCRTIPITDTNGLGLGEAIEIFENGDFARPYPPNGATNDLCVVLKIFGVTDSGGVVVVDVRKSDILRNHPSRN